jgi:hypothetical protein
VPDADCLADATTRRVILILNAAQIHHSDHKIPDERTGQLRRITEDDIIHADVASEFWEKIFLSLIGLRVPVIVSRLRARRRPKPLRLHGKIVTRRHARSPYADEGVIARPIAFRTKREK